MDNCVCCAKSAQQRLGGKVTEGVGTAVSNVGNGGLGKRAIGLIHPSSIQDEPTQKFGLAHLGFRFPRLRSWQQYNLLGKHLRALPNTQNVVPWFVAK